MILILNLEGKVAMLPCVLISEPEYLNLSH